jgi:hypothetical protein
MHTDAARDRAPWDTPTTTAITGTGSRADQPDVTLQNAYGSIAP